MKNFSKTSDATLVADLEAAEVLLQESNEKVVTLQSSLEAMQAQLADVTEKYNAVQEALAASEEAKKLLAEQAKQTRLEARTKAIKEAVGTSKVDALLAATDNMDDEQFNTIVGAMAQSFDAEANSAMFKETGVDAEAPAAEDNETAEMKQLKAKYANQ